MKTRGSKVTIIILTLLIIAVAFSLLFIFLREDSSDTEDSKEVNYTYLDNSEKQTVSNKDIEYSISAGSRTSPCGGTYTNGQSNIASPWLGFVDIGFPSKSKQAKKLVYEADNKMRRYNQDYKFGDYTDEERDQYFNKLSEELKTSFDALKLNQWNSKMNETKKNFNESIVNGNKENCFDQYIVATDLSEYVDLASLKSLGL